jgi:hypothetical protein
MPGFTSPWSRSPPESSRPAGRPTLSDRRRLPRGFPPLRRHPPGQPHIQRHVHRPLRFRSHVFTTSQRFPGKPGLRGLVSCRSRPWGSPFRALLLAGVACASRRRSASLQFSTGRLSQGSSLAFSLRVSPTPAPLDAVAWFPTGARTPFPPRKRGFLGALTLLAHLGVTTTGFGCFEALIPPRSRTAGVAEATFRGRCSPGLRPSRAFLRSSLGAS